MYRVLVPVGHEEARATAQAEYVTGLPAADEAVEAVVLFVFDRQADDLPDELRQFNSATRVGAVRRAVERLEEAGVEVEVREDSGDAATRILEAADAEDVASIVMGGRKRSSVEKALFGSVTQTVLRETDLPVVVTGTREE